MTRSGAFALSVAAALAVAAPSASQAATFLTVGPNALCGANGCFVGGKTSYSQTFSAPGTAGGSFDVTGLQVFKNVVGNAEHTAVKVTFVLSDGTEVSWGKFSLAALGGDVVTLGGQAVAWNSSMGDLTVRLDLVVPEKGGLGGGGGLGGLGGGGVGAPGLPNGGIDSGGPLVRPSFPNNPITAIPEPGAWALMILGFAGTGALLRRRKTYHLRYG